MTANHPEDLVARLTKATARLQAITDAPTAVYAIPGTTRLAVERDDVLMAQYRLGEAIATITSLVGERDAALELLRLHHEWQTGSGVIGLPDGDGGWIEMDNAAEYGDSRLYDRTNTLLKLLPPRMEPMPRGGWRRGSSHWENWQLAYRELRKARKALELAESTIRNRDETIAALRAALESTLRRFENCARHVGNDDETIAAATASARRALASPHQEGTGT